MCAGIQRPLLLVDVDGVISLFGFDLDAPPEGRWQLVDGVAHLLSATAGGHLRRLADAYELVWCTGWGTGSPRRSTVTSAPSGRWPGSTTPTRSAAGRGRGRVRGRPC